MKSGAVVGLLLPRQPGQQEVEPGAEACFENAEGIVFKTSPAFGQTIALQKNVFALGNAGFTGIVEIIELGGEGDAVF